MRGGVDRGFCFFYYRLSYRRKFIRTIWSFLFGMLAVAALLFSRPELWQNPVYIVIGGSVLILLFVAQAAYNYSRWQREQRDGLQI